MLGCTYVQFGGACEIALYLTHPFAFDLTNHLHPV